MITTPEYLIAVVIVAVGLVALRKPHRKPALVVPFETSPFAQQKQSLIDAIRLAKTNPELYALQESMFDMEQQYKGSRDMTDFVPSIQKEIHARFGRINAEGIELDQNELWEHAN